jgi:hypothetical protein
MARRRAHRHRSRGQRGRGLWNFLKKVGAFLKRTKLVSTVGNALGAAGVPYAGAIGKAAGSIGYGRHRIKGMGLRRAGSRRMRYYAGRGPNPAGHR